MEKCLKIPCDWWWCKLNKRCIYSAPSYSIKPNVRKRNMMGRIYPVFDFESVPGCCFYCGTGLDEWNRTKDHVFPKSKNGRLEKGNWVYACQPCNIFKANYTLHQFFNTLKQKIQGKGKGVGRDYLERIQAKVEFMLSVLYVPVVKEPIKKEKVILSKHWPEDYD